MKELSAVRVMLFGAGLLLVAYVVCHLLGLRATTGLLCRVDLQVAPHTGEIVGLILYLATDVGAILVAPILLLAAGMIWGHDKIRGHRPPRSKAASPGSTDA